ncbi:MAG: aspartyl protease family protein [Microscillaceae bacterium]|nr:aspartyl protease family protein [Microscillaceae bacterium]
MKKRSALIWLFICIVHTNYAQNFDLGDIQSSLEGVSVDESIRFEEIDDLMFVRIQINQSEKYFRFLVDTGAPTGISPEVAQIIRPKLGRKVMVKSSGAKDDSLALVLLDSIKIGKLCFKQIVAFVTDFNQGEIMKCYEIDGIIGGNLMAAAIWQFDKSRKQIRITKNLKNLDFIQKTYRQDMGLYGWQKSPLLDISLNDKRIKEKVMLDTGYGGFFSWSRNTYQESLRRKILDSSRILQGSGTAVETIFGKDADSLVYNVQLDNIRLGKIRFDDPVVDVDLDRGSKIGVRLLNQYIITLDFPQGQMYAYKITDETPKKKLESFGFSAYIQENDIYVTLLWNHSPASKAGIRLYDRIIEVNGISFRNINAYNKCTLFLELRKILHNNQEIDIQFASEGLTKTAHLKKEVLLGD